MQRSSSSSASNCSSAPSRSSWKGFRSPGSDGYVKSPDTALRFIPRRCGIHQKYASLLNALGAQPTTADKAGGGRNEMVSPYQCAPQGKHLARLVCGLFYEAVHL
jgi:hypothetical protein